MKLSKEFKQLFSLTVLFALGFLIRLLFIPAKTIDMNSYLQWYSIIAENGIIKSLGSQSFGYNPPFIYLLALATLTRSFIDPVYAIKLIPITFDIINAILVYKLVRLQYPEGTKPMLAAFVFWVLPSIMVNSAFWGQTDSLYTCFLLLTVYLLIKERPTLALTAFALSIAIKAQGVFITPFLGMLFFKKRIPLHSYFIVPLVYAATFIPALLAGRPITSLFATYEAQGETFAKASMNAANPYFFINQHGYETALYVGIPLAFIILLAWMLIFGFKKYEITQTILVFSALVSLALAPFVLPKMHDRYFYPADVFSLVVAFFLPEFWLLPVAYQFVSLTSYLPYLFNIPADFILPFAVGINTAVVLFLLWKQWTLTHER